MTSPAQASGSRQGRHAWYVVAVLLYAVAAAKVIDLSRDRINPDGIAYIENARHYLDGRADLAVNGWFGPLISWLLVPAVRVGGNTVVWFRLYNAAFGVALAAGAMRLANRMTGGSTVFAAGGRWGGLVFAAALLLSLGAVGDELTPDLLAAAALAWYFQASYGLIFAGGPGKALAVGALGGLCYLTKAYALVFVLGHVVMTFVLRFVLSRRSQAQRGAGKGLAAALAGAGLAALPWAALVSLQAGRPCISTMGRSFEAWGPLPTNAPLPVHLLQPATPGRITNWENPVEIPDPWGRWEVSSRWEWLGKLLLATGLNAIAAMRVLFRFDLLGLLLAGWVAGLLLWLVRRRGRAPSKAGGQCPPRMFDPAATGRLWACLSVGFYISGFLPIWVASRYLWGLWSLLLAVFASLLTLLPDGWHRLSSLCEGPAQPGKAAPPSLAATGGSFGWRRRLAGVLAGALIASIIANVGLFVFLDDQGPLRKGREATQLRRLAEAAALKGRLATNKLGPWRDDNWYRGLFTTYWAAGPGGREAQFLGQFRGTDPREIADQLRSFGRATVLIFDDSPLAEGLCRWPGFHRVQMPVSWKAPPRADLLVYDPAAPPLEAPVPD